MALARGCAVPGWFRSVVLCFVMLRCCCVVLLARPWRGVRGQFGAARIPALDTQLPRCAAAARGRVEREVESVRESSKLNMNEQRFGIRGRTYKREKRREERRRE